MDGWINIVEDRNKINKNGQRPKVEDTLLCACPCFFSRFAEIQSTFSQKSLRLLIRRNSWPSCCQSISSSSGGGDWRQLEATGGDGRYLTFFDTAHIPVGAEADPPNNSSSSTTPSSSSSSSSSYSSSSSSPPPPLPPPPPACLFLTPWKDFCCFCFPEKETGSSPPVFFFTPFSPLFSEHDEMEPSHRGVRRWGEGGEVFVGDINQVGNHRAFTVGRVRRL